MKVLKHEEMIVEYLVDKDGDYQYFDNHGSLVRCDEINGYCSPLGYVPHRSVQELLNEIIDLIKVGDENVEI